MVLGEEGGGDLVAESVGAVVGLFLARDQAAEGRLAGAVRADDGELFALVDLEVETAEDVERAVGFVHAFELRHGVTRVRWRREFEIHHRIILFRRGNPLDLGQQLNARLDQRRLVRRGAEAVDEALGFGDFALLGGVLLEADFLAQH